MMTALLLLEVANSTAMLIAALIGIYLVMQAKAK